MRPQDLLGVLVRAAGLYFMLSAGLALVAVIPAMISTGNMAVLLIPVVELIAGLLIVWSAEAIVQFAYR